MKLSWITGTQILKAFREIKTRTIAKDVESTKTAFPFGFDANPTKNYLAIVAATENDAEPVILGYLNPRAITDLQPGDSAQYSTDSEGNIIGSIKLRQDGTAEILGNDDNAVRYSKLEEAYNELNDKFNDLVSAFNQHAHAANATPPTPIPTIIPASPSTGDISPAKIDEIKVPS
jgi:hypothetical protein